MSKDNNKDTEVLIRMKLRKSHPQGKIRLGRHLIYMTLKGYKLNEKELEELSSKGCAAWIITEEEIKAEKKKKASK